MKYQHQHYRTNGSNALKVEELEYDVFIKPRFLSEREQASIIDFDDARDARQSSQRSRTQLTAGTPGRSLSCMINRMKDDRLLGDLFSASHKSFGKKNAYRREDIITFAKGFTVTGIATFVLILFGV